MKGNFRNFVISITPVIHCLSWNWTAVASFEFFTNRFCCFVAKIPEKKFNNHIKAFVDDSPIQCAQSIAYPIRPIFADLAITVWAASVCVKEKQKETEAVRLLACCRKREVELERLEWRNQISRRRTQRSNGSASLAATPQCPDNPFR